MTVSLLWLTSSKKKNKKNQNKKKPKTKKGLAERKNRVTGFGIHSIQHVLICKALFDHLVPITHVQYKPCDMHSHRLTYTSDKVFHITFRVLLLKYL